MNPFCSPEEMILPLHINFIFPTIYKSLPHVRRSDLLALSSVATSSQIIEFDYPINGMIRWICHKKGNTHNGFGNTEPIRHLEHQFYKGDNVKYKIELNFVFIIIALIVGGALFRQIDVHTLKIENPALAVIYFIVLIMSIGGMIKKRKKE